MKNHITFGILMLISSFVVGGCATSGFGPPVFSESGIPDQRYMVGGGWEIVYTAPSSGTAYLIETRTSNIVKTESLEEGERFLFDVHGVEEDEIETFFGMPISEIRLHLYFIPSSTRR
jgi:hypothetical protein